MSFTTAEILTQPECWERAADVAAEHRSALPAPGERVAVVGCGTSWHMARTYAALRDSADNPTEAHAASMFPYHRTYDRVIALSRSGTTTEVLDVLARLQGTVRITGITADPTTPIAGAVNDVISLDFADEQSVVHTRFATSALSLFRASVGHDLTGAIADARRMLTADLPEGAVEADQISFLGTGWTYGLALEAALKLREAAAAWTEAYPAMEYRHGPISVTQPGRVTWVFGEVPSGLDRDVEATGGLFVAADPTVDPMADLVRAQRLAVAVAERRGFDPDRPRGLARSIILA